MTTAALGCLVVVCAAPAKSDAKLNAKVDTVVVCPQEFRLALEPWLKHRRDQGHVFAIVSNMKSADELRAENPPHRGRREPEVRGAGGRRRSGHGQEPGRSPPQHSHAPFAGRGECQIQKRARDCHRQLVRRPERRSGARRGGGPHDLRHAGRAQTAGRQDPGL